MVKHQNKDEPSYAYLTFVLGDKSYTLVPSSSNITALEKEVAPLMELCQKAAGLKLGMVQLALILRVAAAPALSANEAMALMLKYGVANVIPAVIHFLARLVVGELYAPDSADPNTLAKFIGRA